MHTIAAPEALPDWAAPTRLAARAEHAVKVYGHNGTKVVALDDVSVGIPAARFTAIMGPSGSGKSTLMHCLAGLDSLTSGHTYIGDVELGSLSDRELTRVRRERVGFVFQAFNLLPTLDAIENITLPMSLAGTKPDKQWVRTVVDTVGLGDRLKHRPSELSGGQQQRVTATARRRRPRPGVQAGADLRRRADRQPRHPQRRRDPRLHAPRRRRVRPDHRHGHPRPGGGEHRRHRPVPRGRPHRRLDGRPLPRPHPRPHEEVLRCSTSPSRACGPASDA
jgi:predicted ABC-type transport system involved in lysophospholipase L1 biosynthesis ATPase subunit